MSSSSSTEAGCRLPDIDPFDKNAMQYFLTMVPMTCEKEGVLFTRYLDGSLEVVTNHDRGELTVNCCKLVNENRGISSNDSFVSNALKRCLS